MQKPSLPLARTFLLLGGTGFLGKNLARTLLDAGHRVVIAGRRVAAGDDGAVLALPLGDTAAIMDIVTGERVDTIVHLACGLLPSSDQAAYEDEVVSVHLPTVRLAKELAAAGKGLVFVSSGGTVYGKPVASRVNESSPCRPISLYGQSKRELEIHVAFLARTADLDLLILRPSNPYGMHQPLRGAQGFVSVVLGRIADDLPIEIWGEGSTVRDYIHVDDACAAMAGLIGRRRQGTYNIGSGVGHTLIDVVRVVERVTGRPVSLLFRSARAADVPRIVLDVSRLSRLGLNRARPLEEGIRDYARELGMIGAR